MGCGFGFFGVGFLGWFFVVFVCGGFFLGNIYKLIS